MTRLFLGGSSGVLTGALRLVKASIGFCRGIKAVGMWLPRECYNLLYNTFMGTEVRASARMLA
uniref:Uncharacterized protein n=1 Tax=Kangiella spongicola TaxID=796379 RepID=A0A318CZ89_9GAMM